MDNDNPKDLLPREFFGYKISHKEYLKQVKDYPFVAEEYYSRALSELCFASG